MYPNVYHGGYVDYYKEDMINDFAIYDFLLCNTKRHYSVFKWHPQCFYIPWGCDVELYKPLDFYPNRDGITFFHSMGMSNRKGTDAVINTFVSNNMKKYGAKLIIHTQLNIDNLISKEEAVTNNIEIIEKTVGAPGLYYMGDVYVYPAKLDGLGLTMYEAICSGLPVIATDVAPMNEVINNQNGKLIKVDSYFSRSDGYYWPLANINEENLYECMMYYIERASEIKEISKKVREDAVQRWNISDRKEQLLEIISKINHIDNIEICDAYIKKSNLTKKRDKINAIILLFMPKRLYSHIKNEIIKKKYCLK